jgi:hypothetical protein
VQTIHITCAGLTGNGDSDELPDLIDPENCDTLDSVSYI